MEAKDQINILFVSATIPYPTIDGGRIRVLNLVSRLCQIHEVTFLTFITSSADEQGAAYLREMGMEVVGIRRPEQKSGSRALNAFAALVGLLKSSIQRKPLTVAKYYSVEMVEALERLLRSRRFHIVHFEMLHTGQLLLELRSEGENSYATVLGEQNIDSRIWRRLATEESNLLKKLIFRSQYRRFVSYESRICHRFDICLCVSEEDGRELKSRCPEAAIEVVPNGVDTDYFRPEESGEEEECLVFTGSMDWQPNEDAVVYFCDQILPLIQAELPEIKFLIVGSNPGDRVLRLSEIRGVTVTGWVEDVRPYISDAGVFIVPLRIGGGTRLKILQALAMEKAVISTSIGCEGLNLRPGEHILVADEPRQFADETVQLIRDRSLRRRLGENGKTFVQERYDWDVIVKKLELVYRNLSHKTPRDKIE